MSPTYKISLPAYRPDDGIEVSREGPNCILMSGDYDIGGHVSVDMTEVQAIKLRDALNSALLDSSHE